MFFLNISYLYYGHGQLFALQFYFEQCENEYYIGFFFVIFLMVLILFLLFAFNSFLFISLVYLFFSSFFLMFHIFIILQHFWDFFLSRHPWSHNCCCFLYLLLFGWNICLSSRHSTNCLNSVCWRNWRLRISMTSRFSDNYILFLIMTITFWKLPC